MSKVLEFFFSLCQRSLSTDGRDVNYNGYQYLYRYKEHNTQGDTTRKERGVRLLGAD